MTKVYVTTYKLKSVDVFAVTTNNKRLANEGCLVCINLRFLLSTAEIQSSSAISAATSGAIATLAISKATVLGSLERRR